MVKSSDANESSNDLVQVLQAIHAELQQMNRNLSQIKLSSGSTTEAAPAPRGPGRPSIGGRPSGPRPAGKPNSFRSDSASPPRGRSPRPANGYQRSMETVAAIEGAEEGGGARFPRKKSDGPSPSSRSKAPGKAPAKKGTGGYPRKPR